MFLDTSLPSSQSKHMVEASQHDSSSRCIRSSPELSQGLMLKVLGQHGSICCDFFIDALKANLYLPSMPPRIRNSIYQESPVYNDYDIVQLFQELL